MGWGGTIVGLVRTATVVRVDVVCEACVIKWRTKILWLRRAQAEGGGSATGRGRSGR